MWLGSKIFRRGHDQGEQRQAPTSGPSGQPVAAGAAHSTGGGSHDPEAERQAEAGVQWHRQVPQPQTAPVDANGRLPLTELTFDRPAAPSPFGEDVTFPLPSGGLNYAHPDRDDEES